MVTSSDDYPWSSHRAYCGAETIPWFGTKKERGVRAHADFIRNGLAQERRPEFQGEGVADSRVLGDDTFVERLVRAELLSGRVSLENILSEICQRYGISRDELARPGKERAAAPKRAMAVWIVQDVSSVTLTELAQPIGREAVSSSATALSLQNRSATEPELVRGKQILIKRILKCQPRS